MHVPQKQFDLAQQILEELWRREWQRARHGTGLKVCELNECSAFRANDPNSAPRVIIALAKHRSENDLWAAHRFDLESHRLSSYIASHVAPPGLSDGREYPPITRSTKAPDDVFELAWASRADACRHYQGPSCVRCPDRTLGMRKREHR